MNYDEIVKIMSKTLPFWVEKEYISISSDAANKKTVFELSEQHRYSLTVFINKKIDFQCLDNKLTVFVHENKLFDEYEIIFETTTARLTFDKSDIKQIELGALAIYPPVTSTKTENLEAI